jgi:hypothetical protein
MFYTEWCDERGLPYDNEEQKLAWERWCEEEAKKRCPTLLPCLDYYYITRTWMQDREEELRRRSRGKWHRIIFPKAKIPILDIPALANNPWLGWHGCE